MIKEIEKIFGELDVYWNEYMDGDAIIKQVTLNQAQLSYVLTSQKEELKKMIEEKRKEKHKVGDYEYYPADDKGYNQALDDLLSELNHQ